MNVHMGWPHLGSAGRRGTLNLQMTVSPRFLDQVRVEKSAASQTLRCWADCSVCRVMAAMISLRDPS